MRLNLCLPVCAFALILLAFNPRLAGQTAPAVTKQYSFTGNRYDFTGGGSDAGLMFARLVQGNDGNFYGASGSGGSKGCGMVFRMTPAGVLITLHSFSVSDGQLPCPRLALGSDGNFYGTTWNGGSSMYDGTVFRITPTGVLTTLHNFTGKNSDGAEASIGVIQGSDGNFYGTTMSGGRRGVGTVFKITPAGVLTTLHSFTGRESRKLYFSGFAREHKGAAGAKPFASLVESSHGGFYGTTESGGSRGVGTVFKITPAGVFTTMHNFQGRGIEGAEPEGTMVEGGDGNLYGTTVAGGRWGCGTVFRMTPAGVFTTLYSFKSIPANVAGAEPDGCFPGEGLVRGSDDNFYGTTDIGGACGKGTVFQVTPGREG